MTGSITKSDRTRAAILTAARTQFAQHGYERATVRSIARAAGIDASMVIRYFGNKEHLFALASEFELDLPALAHGQRESVGQVLLAHFVNLWEGNESLQVLLRSGVTNPEAAATMQRIFGEQLLPVVLSLGSDRPRERAALVASQVLGLALCRYILHLPPLDTMGREELINDVGPTLQRYLVGPL